MSWKTAQLDFSFSLSPTKWLESERNTVHLIEFKWWVATVGTMRCKLIKQTGYAKGLMMKVQEEEETDI